MIKRSKYLIALAAVSVICFPIFISAQEIFNRNEIKNLIMVPMTRQSTDYTCGVAALQSILAYYGDEIREDNLAKSLGVSTTSGTDYQHIVDYSKSKGYNVLIYKNMTLENLEQLISKGSPIICAIQAWSETPSNYENDWNDGHYVIVIGYDQKRIYIMDPSTLGNYTYIPKEEFLARWHDVDQRGEKLVHFGIVITKPKPVYNPNSIKYLE